MGQIGSVTPAIPRSSSENDQTTGVVEHDPFLMRQGVGTEDTGVGAVTDVR